MTYPVRATPAPVRSPSVHDLSAALAAVTVFVRTGTAEAGAASASVAAAIANPTHLPAFMHVPLEAPALPRGR
jgi:hypothetical protein